MFNIDAPVYYLYKISAKVIYEDNIVFQKDHIYKLTFHFSCLHALFCISYIQLDNVIEH